MTKQISSAVQEKVQDDIVKDLGLEKFSPEMQNDILEKIGELIIKKMFLATMDRLDSKSAGEFEKIVDEEKTPEEIEAFLREKIDGYDEMLEKIVVEVREELKEDFADTV